jgi:hypothetical protein
LNGRMFRFIVKPLSKWAAQRALVGRNRSRQRPELGRFTTAEIRELVSKTWRTVDDVTPSIITEPTFGSRMNIRLAGLTLAFFQNLIAAEIERDYAIELIGDICWQIYQWWGRFGLFAQTISHADSIRDQAKRVAPDGSWPMSFPFNSPGYRTRYVPTNKGLGFDVIRCPVAEYFRKRDVPDLGVGTWCMLDYTLAEMGGLRMARTKTLAAGDKLCDFRWFKAANKQP